MTNTKEADQTLAETPEQFKETPAKVKTPIVSKLKEPSTFTSSRNQRSSASASRKAI
jgi:hypothetical protein